MVLRAYPTIMSSRVMIWKNARSRTCYTSTRDVGYVYNACLGSV